MPKIRFEEVVRFHGHVCPGLAIGYRMALAGLAALSERKAADEEIVAIVENDACGVDALQVLSGCTFGKGNLIFHDYGKSVYTLYSRRTGKGVRIVWKAHSALGGLSNNRDARVRWILGAPQEEVLSIRLVDIEEPPKARIHESLQCDKCGERTMASRIRVQGVRKLCIPCWMEASSRSTQGEE